MGGVSRNARFFLLLAAAAALTVAGVATAASLSVTLTTSGPQPSTVTAALGDTVMFVNGQAASAVVSSERGGFTSPPLPSGASFTHVLTRSGQYGFAQQIGEKVHRGTLVVQRTGSVTFRASATSLPYGSAVTFSGQAAPLGFPVTIQARPAGEREWADATSVTPDAEGRFSVAIRPSGGGQYRATLFGDELVSDRISIVLRPRMHLRALARRANTATFVRFTVRLAPRKAAQQVELVVYDRRLRTWKKVASQPVRADGTATLRWAVSEGRTLVRARVSRKALARGFTTAMSNQVAVTGVGPDPRKRRRG